MAVASRLPFEIIRDPAAMRARVEDLRRDGLRIAVVPTMGYLHDGHLSLLRAARRSADVVILTIFVNPTQFGPSEDLARYPRDEAGDLAKARACGLDLAFCPDAAAMYPPGSQTFVEVRELSRPLCGEKRPGHFAGVATIVTKLFNLTRPHLALFGEKDFQQLALIRRMTRDLDLGVEIVGLPIVREPDGLAMSSRNVYLTPDERAQALALSRGLAAAEAGFAAGERDAAALVAAARAPIDAASAARIDYLELRDADELTEVTTVTRRAVLAMAVFVGKTRLLDNRVLYSGYHRPMRRAGLATVGAVLLSSGAASAQPGAEPLAVTPSAQPEPRNDAAWRLYDEAFAALLRGDGEDAGRKLRALIDRHATHPATAAARPVSAALETPSAERVGRDAGPAAPEPPSAGARAELALFQTLHGMAIGGELCVALECDSPEAVIVLALLGGGLGAGISLTQRETTPGLRGLLNSGTAWGAFNAGMLLAITEPDGEPTYGLLLIGGQTAGLVIGAGIHRTRPTSGQVGLANTVGMWSGAVALGLSLAAEADDQDTLVATLLVADAGLIAGALTARRVPQVSRAQSLVIDAGGIVGALGGAGLGVMVTDEVERTTYAAATAGAVVGLGLAAFLTRGWSHRDAPPVRAAIAPANGGAIATVALDL